MIDDEMLFIEATRQKYRYPAPPGYSVTVDGPLCCLTQVTTLGTEDLWGLNSEQLNEVYKKLNSELQSAPTASLLGDHNAIFQELSNKLRIVEHVFLVKQEEAKENGDD